MVLIGMNRALQHHWVTLGETMDVLVLGNKSWFWFSCDPNFTSSFVLSIAIREIKRNKTSPLPPLFTHCSPTLFDLFATVGYLSIIIKSLGLNLLIKLGHIPRVCACGPVCACLCWSTGESKSEALRVKRLCLCCLATATSKHTHPC